MVERLLGVCEALASITSTKKKKRLSCLILLKTTKNEGSNLFFTPVRPENRALFKGWSVKASEG